MPPPSVHIERKAGDAAANADIIAKAMRAANRQRVTASEVSVLSGVPLHDCEPALLELSERLPVRLDSTEDGLLVFDFERLEPRPPVWTERIAALTARLSARFAPMYSWLAWVFMLFLLTTFFASLTVLLGASPSSEGVEVPRHAIVAMVPMTLSLVAIILTTTPVLLGLFIIIQLVFMVLFGEPDQGWASAFVAVFGALVVAIIYRELAAAVRRVALGKRDPLRLLREFLFGPPTVPVDPLSDERRLTRLIASQHGTVGLGDLVAAFGWTPMEADAQLVRILADYGGDISVNDDGEMFFTFRELVTSASDAGLAPSACEPYRTEVPRFFGNSPGFARVALSFMALNAVVVLASGWSRVFPLPEDFAAHAATSGNYVDLLLFPGLGLWLHALVAGLLLIRLPGFRRRRQEAVFRAQLETLATRWREERAPLEYEADAFSSRTLAELGASVDPEDATRPGYIRLSFPQLVSAKHAAQLHEEPHCD